jgi:hypothetical protein
VAFHGDSRPLVNEACALMRIGLRGAVRPLPPRHATHWNSSQSGSSSSDKPKHARANIEGGVAAWLPCRSAMQGAGELRGRGI